MARSLEISVKESTNRIPARSRVRATTLNSVQADALKTSDIIKAQELASTVYRENKAANAAKGRCEKAKKALDALMVEKKISRVDVTVDEVPVEALYEGGTRNFVDITKLKALVGENVFMQIIEASQKAVEQFAGTNILNACLASEPVEPSLKVRAKK